MAQMVARGFEYLVWAATAAIPFMYWRGLDIVECILLLIAFVTIGILCRVAVRHAVKSVSNIGRLSSGERPVTFAASMEGRTLQLGEKPESVRVRALSSEGS